MRALSIRQPYASAIVTGPKRVENRPRLMGLRAGEWILIHASQAFYFSKAGWERGARAVIQEHWPEAPGAVEDYPTGRIIGAALLGETSAFEPGAALVDPTLLEQPNLEADPWAFGPYCTRIEAVVALEGDYPARGSLGLWKVPEEVLGALEAELKMKMKGVCGG